VQLTSIYFVRRLYPEMSGGSGASVVKTVRLKIAVVVTEATVGVVSVASIAIFNGALAAARPTE
jgi:hypothetical protein